MIRGKGNAVVRAGMCDVMRGWGCDGVREQGRCLAAPPPGVQAGERCLHNEDKVMSAFSQWC